MDTKLARQIAILKAAKEHHEKVAKTIGAQLNELSQTMYEQFADEGVANFRVSAVNTQTGECYFADGQDRIIKPQLTLKGYTIKENQDQFFSWLETHGHADIIKRYVHDKTLSSWILAQKNERQPLPPENLLKVTELTSVAVRRAPKGAKPK